MMGDSQPKSAATTQKRSRWRIILLSVVAAFLGLVAIATVIDPAKKEDAGSEAKASSPSSASQTASAEGAAPERPAGYVSRQTWTDGPWPLTVDEAVLECQGDGIVTITAGEAKYALNAKASAQTDLPDAKEISLPDPDKPGFSLDSKQLIAKGLSLCGITTSSAPAAGSNQPPGLVEKATWTDGPWPFTVDYATLMCNNTPAGLQQVTVTANREMYAMNGTAKSQTDLPDFDVIWRDDPETPGMKVNIGPMLQRGLALCQR